MLLRVAHIVAQSSMLLAELSVYKLKMISPHKYGKWLARRIEKMGGIYVKIGQLLSVRPDLISFPVAGQLYPLLQNLSPVPYEYIKKKIETHFQKSLTDQPFEIDPVPLATGSIAQVHKLKLANGEHAVLKILKPGIKKNLNIDLRMFNLFMKLGAYIPGIKKLPVKELAMEFDTMIRQQLNLQTEVMNMLEFQKNFAGNPDIIIPEIKNEGSGTEFIVLQYLELPPDQCFDNWPQGKRMDIAKKALAMLYQMMFKDGLTHCDMHPGNFFITPEGKLILLDFGMVTRMEGELRNDYILFFFYMATNNAKGCAEIIEKTALHKSKRFDRDFFYKEVEIFIAEFSGLSATQFSVIAFTKRLIQTERRCGIKGSTSFINNILAIVFFESHLKRIDPDIDFQAEAKNYIVNNILHF